MTPIEEIKSRLDIVDIIGGYFPLKQSGTNWKANCPFHQEKTPSFMVSKDKQIWHCFGCNEGGDAISFVQKYEGLEFSEALKMLADKAGVILPDFKTGDQSFKKNILWELNEQALKYWQNILNQETPSAVKTRDYLHQRGLTPETITQWSLGLSSEKWDGLYNYLKEKKYQDEDINQSGLIIRKDSKVFDRFRQRLMFPIRDGQGKVVGFTARTLMGFVFEGEDFGGKYVNTPQTAVYNKSAILYGLDFAKQEIKRHDYVIVVEGNMDVIMSQQAGVKNVVAVSGTALTPDQLRIIKRYTNNIILSFDADAAGSQAIYKSGIISAADFDMNVKALILEGGKDPADIVKANSEDWKALIKKSIPIVDFYYSEIFKRVDINRADHKKIAVHKILSILAMLKDKVEQDHYIRKIADDLNISSQVLWEQLAKLNRQNSSQVGEVVGVKTKLADDRVDLLSQTILALVGSYPACLPALIDKVEPEVFSLELQDLYKKIIIYYTKNQSDDLKGLGTALDSQQLNQWSKIVHQSEEFYNDWDEQQLVKEFEQLSKRLLKRWLQTRLKALSQRIEAAEQAGLQEDVDSLTLEFSDLSKKLSEYLS